MTSAMEARAAMLAAVSPLASERVSLAKAHYRTLAEPIIAGRAQPPFAASAMDGYALRACDAPGRLHVVGEAAAGHAFTSAVKRGEAVRISTGAPMPTGADAVLIQEEACVEGDTLVAGVVARGKHVRDAGVDFRQGAGILDEGRRLDATALALAAAAGAATLAVTRRPRVSILLAGDELAVPGGEARADQIFESCSHLVAAFAVDLGAAVARRAVLPDDPERIRDAAAQALATSDLVIFIGSASVGPHDHAKSAFEAQGARLLVRKVDMRPGKPTWFALAAGVPVLGLPGNPASAAVAATLFLRPLICRLLGQGCEALLAHGRLSAPLPANGAREAYLRARRYEVHGEIWVDASMDQDSSLLSVLDKSNALVLREANAPAAEPGEVVDYLPLL